MTKEIKSVAVLGGGTMGAGIAGLCAERDIKVLILEINQDAVDAAKDRLLNGIPAPIDNPEKMANIRGICLLQERSMKTNVNRCESPFA